MFIQPFTLTKEQIREKAVEIATEHIAPLAEQIQFDAAENSLEVFKFGIDQLKAQGIVHDVRTVIQHADEHVVILTVILRPTHQDMYVSLDFNIVKNVKLCNYMRSYSLMRSCFNEYIKLFFKHIIREKLSLFFSLKRFQLLLPA